MAAPIILQREFSRMVWDVPSDRLPKDAVVTMVDWLPATGAAPARMRGPWTYYNPALPSQIESIAYGRFSAGGQAVGITFNGHLFNLDTQVDKGLTLTSTTDHRRQFALFNDKLIYTQPAVTDVPQKYDGVAAPVAIGGTAPSANFVEVYKGRLILATPTKLYFGAVGDETSFDTANAWIQPTNRMSGIVSLKSAILVFGNTKTERIRGDNPPPSLGMVLEPLFDVGCSDWGSIVKFDDKVIFADTQGVYMTDGATITDLTREGGISRFWRFAANLGVTRMAACYQQGYYIVTSGGNYVFVCDIARRAWFRVNLGLAPIQIASFAGLNRTAIACNQGQRAIDLGWLLDPDRVSPVPNRYQNGDNSFISPTITTGSFRLGASSQRWRNCYIRQRAKGGISWALTPIIDDDQIVSMPDVVVASPDNVDKTLKFPVNRASEVMAFQLSLAAGNLQEAELFDIRADVHGREGLR